MAKRTLDEVYERYFQREVLDGGGLYVGIQEVKGDNDDLVLFNAPSRSTLALRTSECTAENVARKIENHMRAWQETITWESF